MKTGQKEVLAGVLGKRTGSARVSDAMVVV